MTSAKQLLIFKMGDTLPAIAERRGDFRSWIIEGCKRPAEHFHTVDVRASEQLPDPDNYAGVIISGAASMVTACEPWSERCAALLSRVVLAGKTPVLGICYGHQLLAHGLPGGLVDVNLRGREIGTIEVELTNAAVRDALFSRFPFTLRVQATHMESVVRLPDGAIQLAFSDLDPNQAVAFTPIAWGVQFHPEFDADIVRGYIDGRRDALIAEGLDPDQLTKGAYDSLDGAHILQAFAAFTAERM